MSREKYEMRSTSSIDSPSIFRLGRNSRRVQGGRLSSPSGMRRDMGIDDDTARASPPFAGPPAYGGLEPPQSVQACLIVLFYLIVAVLFWCLWDTTPCEVKVHRDAATGGMARVGDAKTERLSYRDQACEPF
jgi:hypothetical protein